MSNLISKMQNILHVYTISLEVFFLFSSLVKRPYFKPICLHIARLCIGELSTCLLVSWSVGWSVWSFGHSVFSNTCLLKSWYLNARASTNVADTGQDHISHKYTTIQLNFFIYRIVGVVSMYWKWKWKNFYVYVYANKFL